MQATKVCGTSALSRASLRARAPVGLGPRGSSGNLSKAWRPSLSSAAPSSAPGTRAVVARAFKRNGFDIADRVIASASYLVPLCDGLRFSSYFFLQFPSFAVVMIPFEPIVRLFYSFPFAGLIAFLVLQLGVVNNMSLSRFVRFNSMQAILLDIVLIVPSLLTSLFGRGMASSSLGLQLQISFYNTVWIFTFVCVAYAMSSCLLGQYARLPLVADAADQQVPK